MDIGYNTLAGLLPLFGALIVIVTIKQATWWIKTANRPPYPPGPKPMPFIGNIFDFPTTDFAMNYLEWGKKYNSDILHASALGTHVVILNSLEDVEELFERRASNYSDRLDIPMIQLMGYKNNMAFMHHGSLWRQHRRMAQQSFRLDTLSTHQPIQLRRVHLMLKGLLEDPDSVFTHTKVLSMSIPLESMYGYDVTSLDDPFVTQTQRALDISGIYFSPASTLINIFPILGRIPAWMPGATAQKVAAESKRLVRKLETEPIELINMAMNDGVANPCALTGFLEARRGTPGFEEDVQIISQVAVTVYAGASDTIVSALSALFYILATQPDIQRKGQDEIDRVIGTERLPDFEDRASLPYTDALYRELLRYWSPIPLGIPHCAREDDYYKGYFIPKGAVVSANIWAMTRNETLYPDPYKFKPERFIDENGQLNDDNRILTYGFGRRICIGKHVANATLWLTIASLLASFDIGKARDAAGNEIEIADDFDDNGIAYRKKPFKCSITPRSQTVRRLVDEVVAAEKLPPRGNYAMSAKPLC